jgi:predicted MFS family arabinose efflux permease
VLGLNTSATYVGVASAGVIGGVSLTLIGAQSIGWISMALYFAALIVAEIAHRVIAAGASSDRKAERAEAPALATR